MTLMTDRMDGFAVVITGVGRAGQVGESVAALFAARGARLVLIDRDATALDERTNALRTTGADVTSFPCDLTQPDAVATVAAQVARTTPALNALVCLAGGFAAAGTVEQTGADVWQRMMAINLSTAANTTRAFLPLLRPARGSIVYFASASVLPGGKTADMSAYAASKSAVMTLMQSVAQEEQANGVRANALAPTSIRTATNTAAMGDDAAYVERETVAEWVALLCAEASRNINGQVIRLA